MSYTVIGSQRSPFARLTRLFLINSNLEFKFEMINYLEKKDDEAYLARVSPINKLPVLIDGDQKIFDSRVIHDYLVRKHALAALNLSEENILTAIHSCLDVSVNLLLLQRGGLSLETENWYVRRQQERIPLALEFLKSWIRNLRQDQPRDWNYLSMALFCYADWAENRGLLDLATQPELAEFVLKFKGARGLSETDFRD